LRDGNYRFNLSARDGYKIDRVEVDGKNKGAILEYTFKNVTADHRIEAWAKANNGQKSFKITSIAQDGGYNDPEGIVQVEQSSSLKVRVAAKDGYRIRDVRVDGKSFGPRSETTFSNIEADHTIESFFQESLFTITAIQNPGGTISPAGTASIPLGGSQTYNVSVNPGSLFHTM
jgi:TusA-related sulfurtransferase